MYVDFDPDDRRKKSARIGEKNFQPTAKTFRNINSLQHERKKFG